MTCKDIENKLKPFLDDLLSEEEYREYAFHLKNCNSCQTYVKSIGSLSNQIWELGNMKVPPDFLENVLAKVSMLKAKKAEVVQFTVSKQFIFIILFIIVAIMVFFLGYKLGR